VAEIGIKASGQDVTIELLRGVWRRADETVSSMAAFGEMHYLGIEVRRLGLVHGRRETP
jgi:hypothetical protein